MGPAVRVLILEDFEDDALLAVRHLTEGGMTIVHQRVETIEGLDLHLHAQPWDVILVDWHQPGCDGWETLRMLKESGKDIPCIIVSGVIGEETAVAAVKAGAHDFVSKHHLARLALVVERELKEAEARRAQREMEAALARNRQELDQANQELKEANRHKDEFLSIISHELRTPLNSITGFASLMEDDRTEVLQPNQRKFLSKIQEGADRMLHLVNNLLDMSRIQAGRLSIRREPIDLGMVVTDVVQSLKPQADQKHLSVTIRLETPELVYLDGARIFQVFANLVSNAIKFTPAGGEICVEARVEDGVLLACVSDTGPGIADDDLPRLFQRFSQLDMRRTRVEEGSGLGLSICEALVSAHGGAIGVTSQFGEGSRFWLRVPAHLPAPTEAAQRTSA